MGRNKKPIRMDKTVEGVIWGTGVYIYIYEDPRGRESLTRSFLLV